MTDPMQLSDQNTFSMESSQMANGSLHRLQRQGARPLVFTGTELAMAMSFSPAIPFWYEINLFRVVSGEVAVAIKKFFQSSEERDTSNSWQFSSLEQAMKHLEEYDASTDLRFDDFDVGKCSHVQLASHALMLQAEVETVRQHFRSLVGELFVDMESSGLTNT